MAELKPYRVELRAVQTLRVWAEHPSIAASAAASLVEKSPGDWRPDTVFGEGEILDVHGQCEGCETWLVEGMDVVADDCGFPLCMPCATDASKAKDERLRERGL